MNGTYIRTQFPGNIIPVSAINPVGAKLNSYFPLPNTTGNPVTGANNFISDAPRRIDQASIDGRIDQNISSNVEHLFGRFGTLQSTLAQPDYFGTLATPGVGANGKLYLNNYNAVLASTTVLSPSRVLELRYGFARFYWSRLFAQLRIRPDSAVLAIISGAAVPCPGVSRDFNVRVQRA